MKKYPKMKPSGVEWIGNVPEKWEVKKIKHTTYVKGRVGWKGLRSDEFLETGFAFLITGTDFKEGKVDWKNCYQISQDRYEEDPFIQLRENDLLITKDGTIGKLAVVENLNGFASLNSGIFVVRPLFDFYHSRFLYYILSSKAFTEYVDFTKSGSTISHLYQNIFIEFKFCCPTLLEQERIISYLNRKTVQLNQTISEKERLIEFFREERQTIINHAVTKGIRAGVKMKASGVEWIGEVPEHWSVNRVKRVCKLQGRIGFKGYSKTDLVNEGEGVLTLGAKHINKKNELDLSSPEFLSWEKYYESPEIMVRQGHVIVTQRGSLGKVVVIDKEIGAATINPSMILLKDLSIDQHFFYYSFNGHFFTSWIEMVNNATAVPMISQEMLANLPIVCPDLEEQKEIVSYLNEKTAQIDTAISGIQQEIALLQEYRQALIFEAVTGKVDVRENNQTK